MRAKGPSAKRVRVKLTKEDWQEIYCALDMKAFAIETGAYGDEARPDFCLGWIQQLRRIMKKIGPAGLRARRRGVARVK